MSKIKIVLNTTQVSVQLLKGAATVAFLEKIANQALQRLGSGYNVNTYEGQKRTNVEVLAETREAYAENLSDNTILKAVWSK